MSRRSASPDLAATRFGGRIAVVTGAGSGIGRATSARLARDGARVACLDVDEATAGATASAIDAEGGVAVAARCDVCNEGDVSAALAQVVAQFSDEIAILVANAGVEGPVATIPEIELADWERVVAVNLTGVFLCAKHVIPRMRAGGGGAIVITASNICFAAAPGWGAYAATKGAVQALTRSLAIDHAPDAIRVNCVCPGPIDTPLLERGFRATAGEGVGDAIASRGRLGQPEEIGAVIAFLASDDAALMSGASVAADAGASARLGASWPSPSYYA